MKKKDITVFIEEMEEIGDEWTPEQVEDAYGDSTLEEIFIYEMEVLGYEFGEII